MSTAADPLIEALKRHFGYAEFRPHQREIIEATQAGRDVLAILPTGAGKSLCFQLPAILEDGITVVVSPLIALMNDQVSTLQTGGIAAAAIHSALESDQVRETMRNALRGDLRLLYVSPERFVLSGFLDYCKNLRLKRIVVDEAHCISEWGHDFRPEYRQLGEARKQLADVPVLAVTATAVPKVQDDIAERLGMKSPFRVVASFDRPNLTYRVDQKKNVLQQVKTFLEDHEDESGIIYCLSRASCESLSEDLNDAGYNTLPYHAGLSPEIRTKNQELFLRDDVPIVCATIAFGMGINKPNVRFVIHADLPKNIEGYYQETGRAGRDGLPSECLLLYRIGDTVKLRSFIDQASDPAVQRVAQRKLDEISHFAQSAECRRRQLLNYFGEDHTKENCGSCDICLGEASLTDVSVKAHKFLSTVARVAQQVDARFGINHHSAVLSGTTLPAIEKWGHTRLSTFGIGSDLPEREWRSIGQALLARGYLEVAEEQYRSVQITNSGRELLRTRGKFAMLVGEAPKGRAPRKTKQVTAAIAKGKTLAHGGPVFEKLRALRKEIASERKVPAFMIFSDATIAEMAGVIPKTEAELLAIAGVGQTKLREFGARFLTLLRNLQSAPATVATADSAHLRPKIERAVSVQDNADGQQSWQLSLQKFRDGSSLEEIAAARGLGAGTIWSHLEKAVRSGERIDISRLVSSAEVSRIMQSAQDTGVTSLKGLFEAMNGEVSYEKIRLVRANLATGEGQL